MFYILDLIKQFIDYKYITAFKIKENMAFAHIKSTDGAILSYIELPLDDNDDAFSIRSFTLFGKVFLYKRAITSKPSFRQKGQEMYELFNGIER